MSLRFQNPRVPNDTPARRYGPLGMAIGLMGLAAWVGSGCGTTPISVLNFTNNVSQSLPLGGGSTTQPAGGGGGTNRPPVNSTCDLDSTRKSITVLLKNEAVQNVAFQITMLVSSGQGGLVCSNDRQSYLDAGYAPVALGAGNTFQLGCDSLALNAGSGFRGGNEMLALSLNGTLPPNLTGMGSGAPAAPSPLDGITPIPVPEVIVLGDNDPLFICQANNACSQGGFTYVNANGVQIDDIFASSTQGTICNAVVGGSRPEWRLLNPSSLDTAADDFQYVTGGNISITILDRVFSSARNKAVWAVIGPVPDLITIHTEQR